MISILIVMFFIYLIMKILNMKQLLIDKKKEKIKKMKMNPVVKKL